MGQINNLEKLKSDYDDYLEKLEAFVEGLKDESIYQLIKEMKEGVVNEGMIEVLEKCEEKLQDEYTKKNREDLEKQLMLKNSEVEKVRGEIKDLGSQIDKLNKKKRTMLGMIWDFFTKKISRKIKGKHKLKDTKENQEFLSTNIINSLENELEGYDAGLRSAKNCIKLLKSNVKQQVVEMKKRDKAINGTITLQQVDELPKGQVHIKESQLPRP